MPWTPELYEIWKAHWLLDHPGKTPPDYEGFKKLAELFDLTPELLFGFEDDLRGL